MPKHQRAREALTGVERDGVVDVVMLFGELLILEGVSALAERDPRFRVVSRPGEGWPGDPLNTRGARTCVALVDGRCPPQEMSRVVRHRNVAGCVVLAERYNGAVRQPLGPRHLSLPWDAPWSGVADALIATHRGEGAGARLRWETEREMRDSLSQREVQVLHLIAEGLATHEIAGVLRLAESTVDRHRSRLLRKIGAKKSADVVRFAWRVGLVAA